MSLDLAREHAELLQFFYALPVVAWRINAAGRIDLMTPMAAQWLQAHALLDAGADGWRALAALDAGLAAQARARLLATGAVALRRPLVHRPPQGPPQPLALSVVVVEPGVLLVTLHEALVG